MRLRKKVIVYTQPMQNAPLFMQKLDFSFPSNVKKIIGYDISANRSGIGTENVFYTTLKVNSDRETLFQGDVLVQNLATFEGKFGYRKCDVDVLSNSVVSGFAVTKSCATNYNATYYFEVLEDITDSTIDVPNTDYGFN
jgi:hypothetical protein